MASRMFWFALGAGVAAVWLGAITLPQILHFVNVAIHWATQQWHEAQSQA